MLVVMMEVTMKSGRFVFLAAIFTFAMVLAFSCSTEDVPEEISSLSDGIDEIPNSSNVPKKKWHSWLRRYGDSCSQILHYGKVKH
jgi:hypothetical protein